MEFNLQRVTENVRKATTEDLLDRATVYRADLEPAVLPVVLEELRTRGVSPEAIVEHEEVRLALLLAVGGRTRRCAFCRRPAVTRDWGWHKLFGKLPVFPRTFYFCEIHRTRPPAGEAG